MPFHARPHAQAPRGGVRGAKNHENVHEQKDERTHRQREHGQYCFPYPPRARSHTHTHTHTYTYIHTHARTHTRTCTTRRPCSISSSLAPRHRSTMLGLHTAVGGAQLLPAPTFGTRTYEYRYAPSAASSEQTNATREEKRGRIVPRAQASALLSIYIRPSLGFLLYETPSPVGSTFVR